MTDLEIDKALALAIGWSRDCITLNTGVVRCYYPKQTAYDSSWHVFSHKDWNVIGPIAEKYNVFPYKLHGIDCHGGWNVISSGIDYIGGTPQRAMALAVIGGAK